ncbi:unnamed protein product [Ostreobium quekettii]|uniref:Disease resistance R13L4/SHOC-2-like LRR domain-containing protein n=1 Tax=Ostreobium quekettii TaxID=121088 RepID=A0A8S1JCJ1_9CHLO|nr:unnamed protein product [Ostreobium quekettii]
MASSLFARHILGVTPGAFELRLELASLPDPSLFVGSPRGFRTASVIEWTDDDLDADVLARARAAMEACHGGLLLERCELALTFKDEGGDESGPPVRVDLSVAQAFPFVYSIELARTNGSGAPKGQLVADLLGLLDLRHARRLKAGAGFGPTIWTSTNMARWEALTHLSLSSSGVGALDDALGALTTLQQLRLSNNKLAALPREVGNLKDLRVLVADHNQLSYIPVDLCNCSELRELNLEHNRLTTPLLDMKRLSKLQSLHLYGNPLEYFPELSVCTTLRALSLANLHVVSDAGFTRFEVQVGGSSNLSGGGQKLTQFFAIIFRRSSCQHALLAGALGRPNCRVS